MNNDKRKGNKVVFCITATTAAAAAAGADKDGIVCRQSSTHGAIIEHRGER